MTISLLSAAAAPSVEVHGGNFIGHDVAGWTVAMICAVIAAFVYELLMALMRKVTLRIPFLVLQFARLQTSKAYRGDLYAMWRAELWSILRDRDLGRLRRFTNGLWYAVQLSAFGARATDKAMIEANANAAPIVKTARKRRTGYGGAYSDLMDALSGPLAVFAGTRTLDFPVWVSATLGIGLAVITFAGVLLFGRSYLRSCEHPEA